MNKTTEALKLAEEALHDTGNALMCLTTTRNLRPMYQEMRDNATEGCNKALAAIREVLAEQQLYEPEGRCKECLAYNGHLDYCSKADPVIKDSFTTAEPVKQEPVEWHVENVYERGDKYFAWIGDGYVQIFTAPVDAKAIRAEERQRCIEAIRKAHHKELCDVWDCIEVIKELE